MKAHETHVVSQFGPQAAAYVTSAVHAGGPDLDALDAILETIRPTRALDLGTGGGHVAYRLASRADAVTAVDLSHDMLAAVAATAADRGHANLDTVAAPAEALPFADESFDFLACRYTAHHWRDLEAGLRQARRVLQRGAPAIFIDAVTNGSALADTHLQAVELLRDPSHVRDYTPGEWLASLARAGFLVQSTRQFRIRMEFASWVQRMRTPQTHIAAILSLQSHASDDVRRHLSIEDDGSFMLDVLLIESRAG